MIETVWLRSSRLRASVEPTRPHPMITTCTLQTVSQRMRRPPAPGSSLAARGCGRRLETDPARAQASQLAARGDAATQEDRAAGLRERRALLGRLCARRDLHH